MRKSAVGSIIWGSILILLGCGFMLQSLGFFDFAIYLTMFWPLILILIGLGEILQNRMTAAAIWIIAGSVFLLQTLKIAEDIDIGSILGPTVLIIIGLRILGRANFQNHVKPESGPRANASAFFSEANKKIDSQDFQAAELNAVFGSSNLDLRNAKIGKNGATIDVLVLFGGATILVPEGTLVNLSATAIFGGSDDKRTLGAEGKGPRLTIEGVVLFGGLEIKD